ncbi:MAG: hypothetical protein AAB209_01300 [Bacteroidota bacterium]|jgi:hypothetical protein
MKKNGRNDDYELRPEYDFSKMKRVGRGMHVKQYRKGTNLVLLEPDVYKKFRTAKAVNDALRLLMKRPRGRVRRAA